MRPISGWLINPAINIRSLLLLTGLGLLAEPPLEPLSSLYNQKNQLYTVTTITPSFTYHPSSTFKVPKFRMCILVPSGQAYAGITPGMSFCIGMAMMLMRLRFQVALFTIPWPYYVGIKILCLARWCLGSLASNKHKFRSGELWSGGYMRSGFVNCWTSGLFYSFLKACPRI